MIKKMSKYLSLFLVCFGIIALILLSIIGGIQTGDLTWTTLPVWLWNNVDVLYFFLGCFTVGGATASIFKTMGNKDKEDKEDEAAFVAGVMLLLSGLLWPIVWSNVAFNWIRKKEK